MIRKEKNLPPLTETTEAKAFDTQTHTGRLQAQQIPYSEEELRRIRASLEPPRIDERLSNREQWRAPPPQVLIQDDEGSAYSGLNQKHQYLRKSNESPSQLRIAPGTDRTAQRRFDFAKESNLSPALKRPHLNFFNEQLEYQGQPSVLSTRKVPGRALTSRRNDLHEEDPEERYYAHGVKRGVAKIDEPSPARYQPTFKEELEFQQSKQLSLREQRQLEFDRDYKRMQNFDNYSDDRNYYDNRQSHELPVENKNIPIMRRRLNKGNKQ